MVIFAKAYSSIKSAFSAKETTGKWTTSPKQSSSSVLNTKTEKTHILIHSSSASTKGLFVSREHNQQNQLRLPPQNARQQMQTQNTPATLDQHRHGFYELHKLLPYDILCLIFDTLGFMDLWRCTNVCQAWCSFMLEWPEFWRKLTIEIPHVKRSMLEPLLRRQAHEFRLEGQLSHEHMHVLLTLLLYSESHFIRKLCKCYYLGFR
ncbi:hypothetical protein BJV82DRAFT_285822 [Fennellomyces sp. T-0311]|nr:hypothetical protein BJV82DRAFT_285822 [Fennellomyces sp. T-0311]